MVLGYKHFSLFLFVIFVWCPLWCATGEELLCLDGLFASSPCFTSEKQDVESSNGVGLYDEVVVNDLGPMCFQTFDKDDDMFLLGCEQEEDGEGCEEGARNFSCASPNDQGEDMFLFGLAQEEDYEDCVEGARSSCAAPNGPPALQRHAAKTLPTRERINRLMQCLKDGWENFASLKDTVYVGCERNKFETDILQAMFKRADIREEKGRYHYFRELKEANQPSKNVALAMFDLLKEKQYTLFGLRFQLYRAGYISYSPEHLIALTKALTLGGVHPYDVEHLTRSGVSINDALHQKWVEVQNCSVGEVDACLSRPTQTEGDGDGGALLQKNHRQILKKNHRQTLKKNHRQILQKNHRQILKRLWELKNTKVLDTLRTLKKQLPAPCEQTDCAAQNYSGKRQKAIITFLSHHKNETFSADELLQVIVLPEKTMRNAAVLLRAILTLAIKGSPIIYDKALKSVTLVEKIPIFEQPPQHTNLLTMLYDLMHKYGVNINVVEVAYYAHRGGYWPCGFGARDLARFYKTIHSYKDFLMHCGYTSPEHREQKQRAAVSVRSADLRVMWSACGARDQAYDTFCTHTGFTMANAAEEPARKKEFMDFLDYVSAPHYDHMALSEKAKIMQSCVCASSLTQKLLWRLCESFGMLHAQDLWAVACKLTQNVSGGRLLYDPKTSLFSWDSQGHYTALTPAAHVAEIYLLQDAYPHMSSEEFVYMLAQNGGQWGITSIQKGLFGLELLGFRPESEDFCPLSRNIFKSMLVSKDGVVCVEPEKRAYDVAQEVYSWLDSGAMALLWKTYLNASGKTLQEVVCEGEGPPPQKRKKADAPQNCPEAILARDIPELKVFLLANVCEARED